MKRGCESARKRHGTGPGNEGDAFMEYSGVLSGHCHWAILMAEKLKQIA